MMSIIHLANTDFEFELIQDNGMCIEESWKQHPLCYQLQYLPYLYAEDEDLVAVSSEPDSIPWRARSILLGSREQRPGDECRSWGYSRRIQRWAEARQIIYRMPPWEVIKKVNSKAYSFERAPQLNHAALINNENELGRWLDHTSGLKVLKTCYGLSGRGHHLIYPQTSFDQILAFCQKEWALHRPLIGEPWLERVVDFSTQWFIHSD